MITYDIVGLSIIDGIFTSFKFEPKLCDYSISLHLIDRKKFRKHQERLHQQQQPQRRHIAVKNQIKMRRLPSSNPDFDDARSILSSQTIDENDSVSQVGRPKRKQPRQLHSMKPITDCSSDAAEYTNTAYSSGTESKEDLVNKLAEKLKDNPEMEQALLNLPLDPGEDEEAPREIKTVLRKFGTETLLQTLVEINDKAI